MEARIVRATDADLAEISRLAGLIWRAHYPGIISAEQIEYMLARMYALEVLREEVLRGGIRYDRLILAGEGAGFAACGPAQPGVVKLHKLYVRPEWHGRGFGSLLLRHCEREAAKGGAKRLILSVNKQNAKAIAAYRRNGFTLLESVTVDIGGGFVMDDYVFGKDLASPETEKGNGANGAGK